MEKKATIKDVAELVGVSIATVSRVVNNHGIVAPDTQRRVNDAIRELDYNPNTVARSLATGRTETILLYIVQEDPIVPTTWSYELPIIQGINDYLRGKPWDLQITMCSNIEFRQPGFLNDRLNRRSVGGVLIMSAWVVEGHTISELEKRNVPYVLIGCNDPNRESPSVEYDNTGAVQKLVEHLKDQGCEILGLIGGDQYQLHMRERLQGFELALAENGLSLCKRLIKTGDWSVEIGYLRMKELLRAHPKPTGIVCGNDYIAVGAMDAIKESGANIPRDVAIVGFDDTIVSQVVTPNLTTVRVPLHQMGMLAAERLDRTLSNPLAAVGRRTVLPCEIVVRESSSILWDRKDAVEV
jgi:LacI family transcriptional regulator